MEHEQDAKHADELPDGSQSDTTESQDPGEDTNSGGGPAEPASSPQE